MEKAVEAASATTRTCCSSAKCASARRRFDDSQSGLGIGRNTLAKRLSRLVDENRLFTSIWGVGCS
jgi:hypothetical protein